MRKVCVLLIICIITNSIFFASFAIDENVQNEETQEIQETNESEEENNVADDFNELKEQKTNLEEQIEESNNELSDVNEELTENLQKIQELDENITNTEEEITTLEQEIEELENEINQINEELELVTEKYNTQKNLLDARLVEIYETGNTTYLELVLQARSLSDLVSSYYIISELTSYDMELLELVADEKNEIEEKSNSLNSQKKEIEEKKTSLQKKQISVSNTKILRQNYVSKLSEEEKNLQDKIDEYQSQVALIEAEIKSLAAIVTFGEDYSGGPMQWPINGYYTVTSSFGMRTHPITGVYKLHTGVDISAPIGASFTAIADGIVVKAGYNTAYGNMVIIDHGGGVQTLYAHGSEICVELGQTVQAGDEVLKVGSTGYSTGAHAHFEVRVDGTPVNPLDYVSIPEH